MTAAIGRTEAPQERLTATCLAATTTAAPWRSTATAPSSAASAGSIAIVAAPHAGSDDDRQGQRGPDPQREREQFEVVGAGHPDSEELEVAEREGQIVERRQRGSR